VRPPAQRRSGGVLGVRQRTWCPADARDPGIGLGVSYVVIPPDGPLQARRVDGRAEIDEWGTPYQKTLWAAVRHDVDPYLGAVHGVTLSEELRAKVADRAGSVPQLYPSNPVASAVLTTLGHPPHRWSGTIAIVGTENEDGLTAPLTTDQLALISKAHRLACAVPRGQGG
jgi:hypothetical protein